MNEPQSLEELLSAYADGEATPDEVRQIEAILLSDAEAQQRLAFVRALRTVPPTRAAMPIDLSARIAAETYAKATIWTQLAALFRPAPARYALGGALATILVGVLVLPRLPQQEAPTASNSITPRPQQTALPKPPRPIVPENKIETAQQALPAAVKTPTLTELPPTDRTPPTATKSGSEVATVAPDRPSTPTAPKILRATESRKATVATMLGPHHVSTPMTPSAAAPTAHHEAIHVATHSDAVLTSMPSATPTPGVAPLRSRVVASASLAGGDVDDEITSPDGPMKFSMNDLRDRNKERDEARIGGKQSGANLATGSQSGRFSILDAPVQNR